MKDARSFFTCFKPNRPLPERIGISFVNRLGLIFIAFYLESCGIFPAGVVTQKELQQMTPAAAIARLEVGNKRFVDNRTKSFNWREQRHYLSRNRQSAPAVVLTGTDPRTAPELVFNQCLGDMFTLRFPANMATSENIAAIEFQCRTVGSKVIVVLAQTHDPYIEALLNNDQTGNQPYINYLLKPALTAVQRDPTWQKWKRDDLVNAVMRANLAISLQKITTLSPSLKSWIESGYVALVGAVYDVDSGKVFFLQNDGRN